MRKKLQILFILLISLFYKGQDNSLAASVNTPAAYQTGVPSISYPLGSLPATKDFTINFGLIYNPNSYEGGNYSGRVGVNWMLTGSNYMVTKDENDQYYYNVNNEQGSFQFEKSGTFPNDVYKVIMLTTSTVKITCERIQTDASFKPRHIKSFKIVDSKGYKYFFEDYEFHIYSDPFIGNANVETRNVFYVTKIEDASDNIVAVFKNKKYDDSSDYSTTVLNCTYIPESITTKYGKMIFEPFDSGSSWDLLDRFSFKNFSLKDHNNKFISKYELDIYNSSYKYYDPEKFGTNDVQTIKTRSLGRLKKLNENSDIIDETNFDYTYAPPSQPTWGSNFPVGTYQKGDFLLNGLLKSVRLSSGSKIEYTYGFNSIKIDPVVDYNTPDKINQIQNPFGPGIPPFSFKKKTDSIHFDSKITKKYYLPNLIHSPQTKIYVKFNKEVIYPFDPGGPTNPTFGPTPEPKLVYRIKNSVTGTSTNQIEDKYYAHNAYIHNDGSIFLEIEGTGGNGWFEVYENYWTDPPYLMQNNVVSKGVRIENIKYYDKGENFYPGNPNNVFNLKKTLSFNYDRFSEPGFSSGVLEDTDAIIYKNVKVTESDKPGYTRYYYKHSNDFPAHSVPSYPGYNFYPHGNYTKRGVLFKKEMYNINNVKKSLAEIDYIFPPYNNISSIQENLFPEKTTATDTSYDGSGNPLINISEQTFNQDNNNLMTEKRTSADGTFSETIYQYAAEKGNSKLLNVGMISVPLEVTQKQNNIQTGKLETKYDHADNYFPSSVTSFGINNMVTGEQTNDIYDNMGNVLQTTSKSGVVTAIIWGYARTQPIAKIEGTGYNNMLALMGQSDASGLDIVQRSNVDIDDSSEQNLRNALETFRRKSEFKNYLITTYTYDPLIGVKSVTSPNGFTEYYYYDNQNRMVRVEDTDHHVIKENKYLQNLYTN